MNLRHFWAFLAVALPVLAALLATLPATDLAYHLRAGAEILDTGRIPETDSWTFTANGLPWVDQQWGAQVLLTLVYRIGGWVGLVVLRAALVGLIFSALLELCRRQGIGLRLASWLTLAAFVVASPALALRPQLLGMALFAVTLLLVMDREAHPRRLWLIPLITLAWANIHGSFFLAPAVLALAWLADLGQTGRERHLALVVGAVSTIAACVTPFGPAVWAYAVGLGVNPEVTQRITEWQPTSLRTVPGIAFYASAMLVAAFLARRDRRAPWAALAWLAFFFMIGAYAERGIAWWPLGAVAVLATLIGSRPMVAPARTDPPVIRRTNATIATLLVLAGIVLLPVWRPTDPNLAAPTGVLSQAPAEITGELRRLAQPGDRLFNPQRWGSWFEFALPELPVAIDSRIELFPPETWDEYVRIESGSPGWEATLAEWDVTIIVVDGATDAPFAQRLEAAGWQRAYTRADGTILIRPDQS